MLTLIAQSLTNPAVQGLPDTGANSGEIGASILGHYIAIGLVTAVAMGALAVLLYFILGAINWITAGGDKGKVEKAQQRIIQAFVGFGLLVFAVTIIQWVGPTFFGIDLLNVEFVNQLGGGGGNNDDASNYYYFNRAAQEDGTYH
jgi:hypothetical protein